MSDIPGLDHRDNRRDADARALTRPVARRECKTGLAFIAPTCPDCTVYVCLAGLDFAAVGDTSHDGAGPRDDPVGPSVGAYPWHETSRSITRAGPRWLFRNRREPAVRHLVQVRRFRHGSWSPCGAPWEEPAIRPGGGVQGFAACQRARVDRGAMDSDG